MQPAPQDVRVEITGGADAHLTAAILAVVQRVEEERVFTPLPRNPNVQSAWLRSGRHGPIGRFDPPVRPQPGLNWPD